MDLQKEVVQKYMVTVNVTGDWVSYKNPAYPPNSPSLRERRFNISGVGAFYLASGIPCAQAEVPSWQDRQLYRVSPGIIHAFDLPRWAKHNGCWEDFVRSKEEGGYGICQDLASNLSAEFGVTGVLYNSHQLYMRGETGCCLFLQPQSGQMVGDTFFIKEQNILNV